jgi:catechol 2,3-dioxygenase-like lactoylglutathione lyase family enzyme
MEFEDLSYVAVVSRDVAALTRFLGGTLGLARTDIATGNAGTTVPVFAVGRSAIAVFEPGGAFLEGEERTGVHHIALGAQNVDTAAAHAEAQGIAVLPGTTAGLQNRKRWALDPRVTAGVRTFITEPLERQTSLPGNVQRIDHLGIASADNGAAVDIFSRRLGLTLESQQTDMEVAIAVESFTSDKYGVVHHTRPAKAVGGLRVAFITAGDCELEFLQNFDPAQGGMVDHGSAGTTRQDQGAITRYIAGRGAGLHHIAFKVGDIDKALADARRDGFATIDATGRPGSRRALIGFVQPKGLGGVLMHFVQRDEIGYAERRPVGLKVLA